MPRKGSAPRRDLMPDPVHRSVVVTQLVNKLLQRGKRSLSEKIVYDALSEIERNTGTGAHPPTSGGIAALAAEPRRRRPPAAASKAGRLLRPASDRKRKKKRRREK